VKHLSPWLASWLLSGFLAFFAATTAADTLKFGNSAPLTATNDNDFLPVAQAYQLHPRIEGNTLVLEWLIAPGYYLYQQQFKTRLANPQGMDISLSQHFLPGTLRYDDYYEKELVVYYDATTVSAELPGLTGDLIVTVESQACADAGLCYPPRSQYIKFSAQGGTPEISDQPLATATNSKTQTQASALPLILLFAALGGLLLNLMPCVFPVLSIKVLSLTSSQLSPHRRHIHGFAYTLGVVITFVAVALLLTVLRAGGEALGWGFQLQSPAFIIALTYLFFIMGLSFSGFFTAGSRLMNLGQAASGGSGLQHSFLTGVLATVVASPCSAPFMGTALGFALTQPTAIALLIFAFLGLGMALPFVVLTWAPGLLKKLPKPGAWMETLKEFLAFPLYLTCLWLLWILGHQTDADTLVAVLAGLVLLSFAIWLGNQTRHRARPVLKGIAVATAIAALLLPAQQLSREKSPQLWEPYSEKRLSELLENNRSVFINLTADWCLTCLANEKIALSSKEFAETLRNRNIVYLKGDWTNYDGEITALLNANGRNGVPLYLYYPAGARQPQVLPQILSTQTVIRALNREQQQETLN